MVNLLLTAVVALIVLVLAVRWFEPRFTFFPLAGEQDTPASLGMSFESVTLSTKDGEQLRAWFLPSATPRALVVYFHGNGGNLAVWMPILVGIQKQRFSVAAIDYRGYGASSGRPSEQGLYRDVDAALEWSGDLVKAGVPVIYWGRSLGTTMAAYAAATRRPDGLILESGFASARSLLRASPPLAFLALLSTYRFPTAEYAGRTGCPTLVMHGDDDRVIPFSNGRQLFESLPEPKRFHVIPRGDHNDVTPPDPERYWAAVTEFIASLR
jgi:fermentation-respiration switch protein FrsA (DUF1100 family)